MEHLKKQLYYQASVNWRAILSAIILVSATIFIIGFLILGVRNFLTISGRYFDQRYYSFLLNKDITPKEVLSLETSLQELLSEDEIDSYTRQELFDDFTKDMNIDGLVFEQSLIELGGAIDFVITKPTSEQIKFIEELADNEVVASVVSNDSFTEEVVNFLNIFRRLVYIFIALVVVGSILSIYIVIQLLVYSNSKDIKIVRSLGGSWLFILNPFLVLAFLIIVAGYSAAIFCSWLIFQFSHAFFARLDLLAYLPVRFSFFSLEDIINSFLVALILGMSSAYFAGRRVLNTIDAL
ncbi:MAG: hypothetical protein JJV97_03585 [SAR324 cluster bacterium]|nr:hypothetical protein [SAR324 cluster bacterium]